jgi:hypothetical protein
MWLTACCWLLLLPAICCGQTCAKTARPHAQPRQEQVAAGCSWLQRSSSVHASVHWPLLACALCSACFLWSRGLHLLLAKRTCAPVNPTGIFCCLLRRFSRAQGARNHEFLVWLFRFSYMHVRVVYYDYATEEQPYCNTNTSCPRLPDHCLTGSLRYTHICLQLRLSSAPLVFSSAWPQNRASRADCS